ncbi:hypothetical protein G6F22_016089 [Rhizopus arrhizus]|nr:hypothetical protein G6F22_016089 [Rhizopus arrhizus]
MAASVMAAGSVMNEPPSGTSAITTKNVASSRGKGSTRATMRTSNPTSSRMGRLAATTMITKTNRGSVKLRVSM